MIGEIEAVFVTALQALDLKIAVHRGVDFREIPSDSAVLTVDCRQIQHVTPALYSGEVSFLLSSSALQADLALHNTRDEAIQNFLRTGEIKIHFLGESLQLAGIWLQSCRTSSLDYRWVSEIACMCGIAKL